MPISAKLADEIFLIEGWHLLSLLISFGFNWVIARKARKGALLTCYLLGQGSLALWMLAKIAKTVAPTLELRWSFVVLQYFASSFLGPLVLLFAIVYRFHSLPSRQRLTLLFLPGLLGFLVVMTNPWHGLFYSRFTFYADDFGPLFYMNMSVTYAYLALSFFWLSRDYQSLFQHRQKQAILFTAAILLPLLVNVFYIFGWFKMLLQHTPRFDYTPIATNASLILFALAAMRTRFLDILPLAQKELFQQHGDPCLVCDEAGKVLRRNPKAERLLADVTQVTWQPNSTLSFNGELFEAEKNTVTGGAFWRLRPVTVIRSMMQQLEQQNITLQEANRGWQELLQRKQQWVAWKARQKILQELHDVLGHTVVLALSTAEVALLSEGASEEALRKIRKTLIEGRQVWRSLWSEETDNDKTSLQMAIDNLKGSTTGSGVLVTLLVQGEPYELLGNENRVLFRLLQESVTNTVKHSGATRIDVVLRYQTHQLQLIILDNGCGCNSLQKGHGLLGMEKRVWELGGTIFFTTGEGEGFRIDVCLKRRDIDAL